MVATCINTASSACRGPTCKTAALAVGAAATDTATRSAGIKGAAAADSQVRLGTNGFSRSLGLSSGGDKRRRAAGAASSERGRSDG